jgi:ADP-ribose pyrophosphatase YjhB (NUDIX family)
MDKYVGTLILENGKILLVQNAHEKARGQWSLPAGRVEENETLEDAAFRETKEETGFNIKILRRIKTYQFENPEYSYHVYAAEIVGGEIQYDPEEIMNLGWFSVSEIEGIELRPSNSFIPDLLNPII